MSDRKRKEITGEAIEKVNGGLAVPGGMGGANCNGVAIMQWCDKCKANTPHNANGECMTCKQSENENKPNTTAASANWG